MRKNSTPGTGTRAQVLKKVERITSYSSILTGGLEKKGGKSKNKNKETAVALRIFSFFSLHYFKHHTTPE